MTKGALNIAAAELQQKVDRIEQTRQKALLTAEASVNRKYKKQIQELLDSKYTNTTDGEGQDYVYPREAVNRVEFPEFWTFITHDEMKNDTIEDLNDTEVQELNGDENFVVGG